MKYTITDVKIFCAKGKIIENGFISIEDNKFVRIGEMSQFKKYGTTISKKGMVIIPGLVDAHTHVGMRGDSLGFESDELNETTDPNCAHLRALDAVNVLDRCFEDAYKNGVTTLVTGPGSANPIAGQAICVKTYGKSVDEMKLLEPCAVKLSFGENPKSTYASKDCSPKTRMATAAIIRNAFYMAKEYGVSKQKTGDTTAYNLKNEALLKALKGEIKVHIHAHRADDILTALRVVKEFNLNAVLIHCTEGYKITEQLKNYGVSDIFAGPLITDRSKPELCGKIDENAMILHKAGFNISLITDHPELPIDYLRLSMMLSIKGGLDKSYALDCVTINPAKSLGLQNRIGSIEEDKDADFVILDGTPFDLYSNIVQTYINGKCIYSAK